MQTYQFQAETKQLLDLMIHSIYSNKDIFLRELISNSSDALDKLKFASLTQPEFGDYLADPHIRIEPDAKTRTLRISDNGIGMSRDEVIEFIGTIAKSGTKEFLKILQENKDKALPPELIGQFGVGLYSSFMAADKITLVTRKAGETHATRFESSGDGSYTIDDADRDAPGTDIILHLKTEDTEDGLKDYTAPWVIRQIVKRYSDYVSYPIRMKVEKTEYERDDKGNIKDDDKGKKIWADETLNSMKAIWTRASSEVSEDEYKEFYKHISHDWNDPLDRISIKAEGKIEFRGLLFFPSKAPFDLFMHDAPHGIHLYIRRVFIMSDCKDLIPVYLRFMRGVVDSEDLSLNISREILQQNRQIQLIRKHLTGKVLDTLKEMMEKDIAKYEGFWKEFGRVLKEGIFLDRENQEKILDIALFDSSDSGGGMTSLAQYMDRMKEGQDAIFYATGKTREAIEGSPHLEAFRQKNYEVLYLTDPVDEVWVQSVMEYRKKPLKAVGKGAVELGSEEEKKQEQERLEKAEKEYKSLLDFLRKELEEDIKDVRLSSRLTTSPVCLVGDAGDLTPQMQELLKNMGQEIPVVKRILEINPAHPILEKLQGRFTVNPEDPVLKEYAVLLHGQALLAESSLPPKPGEFSRKIASILARALDQ